MFHSHVPSALQLNQDAGPPQDLAEVSELVLLHHMGSMKDESAGI